MEKEAKNYEIAFLARTEDDQAEIVKLIARHQIKLIDEVKEPARIRLAYPIKKEGSAFFNYFYFSALPEEAQKLRGELDLNQKVLRFLIIARPKIQISAQTIARPIRKTAPAKPRSAESFQKRVVKRAEPAPVLSNEALEKKLEEILK